MINHFPSCQQHHLVLRFHCCLESFVTALLLAGNHPAHINVVLGEGIHGFLNGGVRQGSCSAQDPGEVDVEEPQDVRAGIHQGRVHVVSGQDPVRRVGQDCGCKKHKTKSKATMFSPDLPQGDKGRCMFIVTSTLTLSIDSLNNTQQWHLFLKMYQIYLSP